MIRILIISLLFVSCKGKTTETAKMEAINYSIQIEQIKSDTLLVGIQSKIYDAFVQSLMSKNDKALSELRIRLVELNKSKKQNLILYWQSYLQFYSSIYYLKNGDNKTAEKEIDKGIECLDKMKHKNSEDYTLLAMLQGYGLQFKGMRAMFISGNIKENLKKAIAIDSTNLRAYYVYASNDFHTPEKYGGGKETEKYLLKAINLPAQKVENNDLPSWGKEESYEILIKYYIKKENWEFAKKYYQEAIKEFPESYTISLLATRLVGK